MSKSWSAAVAVSIFEIGSPCWCHHLTDISWLISDLSLTLSCACLCGVGWVVS
jgi:hypothetical protein